MPAFLKKRDNILVLAFGLVLVFFIGRMLQMQLIQGDEYESQIYKGTIKTQTVEAARGEITEQGTHDALLAQNGGYCALYTQQRALEQYSSQHKKEEAMV